MCNRMLVCLGSLPNPTYERISVRLHLKKNSSKTKHKELYISSEARLCVCVCVCVVVSPSVLSQGRPLEPWTHCNSYLFVFGYMCCMYACLLTHTDTLALQGLSKGYAASEGQTDRATSHLSACCTPPLLTSAANRTRK